MKLATLPEPKAIKQQMKAVHASLGADPGVNWESMVVWHMNQMPKYFWDSWKDKLKAQGFTWAKFMHLLHYRTDNLLMWYRGIMPWSDLVKTVEELVEGPLGKDIAKRS
ncbi:MAG TPA: hypothetical protein VHE10_02570 [Candidatus Paceibacterota bacterium]|nr:hypothetical protein [Candidatus Paceibacterota bacterium]